MYGACKLAVTVPDAAGLRRNVSRCTARIHLMVPDIADVTDRETFDSALTALVQTAHENGVPVDGGWEVDGCGDVPAWDVIVTAVERGD